MIKYDVDTRNPKGHIYLMNESAIAIKEAKRQRSVLQREPQRLKLSHDAVEQAKKFRRQLNLSQADFAERFGLPLQTYVQWERGRRQPEISALMLLSVIVNSPEAVTRIVRRQKRREMALVA
jgi:putative transcriptional regulator